MSIKKPNPKRNHHELPRFYLQGFCEESSFLWIYERGKPYIPGIKKDKFNPYRRGIVEIAEKDRYAIMKPDGTLDFESYENRLEKIEKSADVALRKIHSQAPIDSDEKEIIASYIQNLHKRTKEREKRVVSILDKNQVNFQQRKFLLFESMVARYPTLHHIIKSMSWRFYVAPIDSYFVTSSTPVFFDRRVGLALSPILFPVSKNITLIATHQKKTDLEYVNASLDETFAINYYTIINALSVYSPKAEKWIWEILEKGIGKENLLVTLEKLLSFT